MDQLRKRLKRNIVTAEGRGLWEGGWGWGNMLGQGNNTHFIFHVRARSEHSLRTEFELCAVKSQAEYVERSRLSQIAKIILKLLTISPSISPRPGLTKGNNCTNSKNYC